jgi:hypothetical protein
VVFKFQNWFNVDVLDFKSDLDITILVFGSSGSGMGEIEIFTLYATLS